MDTLKSKNPNTTQITLNQRKPLKPQPYLAGEISFQGCSKKYISRTEQIRPKAEILARIVFAFGPPDHGANFRRGAN